MASAVAKGMCTARPEFAQGAALRLGFLLLRLQSAQCISVAQRQVWPTNDRSHGLSACAGHCAWLLLSLAGMAGTHLAP
jgi:hypothetical protein